MRYALVKLIRVGMCMHQAHALFGEGVGGGGGGGGEWGED